MLSDMHSEDDIKFDDNNNTLETLETPNNSTSYFTYFTRPFNALANYANYLHYLVSTKNQISSNDHNVNDNESLDVLQLKEDSYFTGNISNCVVLSERDHRFKVVEFLLRNWQIVNTKIKHLAKDLDIDIISYGYHNNMDDFNRINKFIKNISDENVSIHMINLSQYKGLALTEYKRLIEEYEMCNMSGIVPINKYKLVIVDNIDPEMMKIKFSIAPHIIMMYLSSVNIIPSTVSYIVSNVSYMEFIKPYLGNVYDQLNSTTITQDKNIYFIANSNKYMVDLSDSVNYVRI